MYSAAFIFKPGEYTDEFDHLNTLIDEAARNTPGFICAETRTDEGEQRINITYYWEDLDALEAFSKHPDYLRARNCQCQPGCHRILLSEEVHSYGDGAIDQLKLPEEK
ncbi:MAG: antibiotic biosynthesis monooxygenase [Marinobacterium sp.]|nr:antibiotic biosynthesis monooxygenase [Marinobacterium sp.]